MVDGNNTRNDLPAGYAIHWYQIQSVLGKGGYGVTYLAEDTNLKKLVAIKEYFPKEYAAREAGYTVHPMTGEYSGMFKWGLDRFLKEARTLAQFKHPNIVRVLSVFELNNTAYMVMEYEQGEDLSKIYKKESLSEQRLLDIYLPIIDGLSLVHEAGFIHRDVKPSNIYIRQDGSPVLLDFGSARQSTGKTTVALTSLITYGFAPYEQYAESDDKQGPWTDIYALGACLYLAVTGNLPREAMSRGSEIISSQSDPYEKCLDLAQDRYSADFLRAIDRALNFQIFDRPQTLQEWKQNLQGEPIDEEFFSGSTVKLPSQEIFPAGPVSKTNLPQQLRKSLQILAQPWLLGVALVVLLGLIVSVFIYTVSPSIQTPITKTKTQLQVLLESANRALETRRLIEPQGKSAIDLYNKILAMEPKHPLALQNRQHAIDRYALQIREDIDQGRVAQASRKINLLFIAAPDESSALYLQRELDSIRARRLELSVKLDEADQLKQAKKFMGQDNAHELYGQVLAIEPENTRALAGIKDIVQHYYAVADRHLKKGAKVKASKAIEVLVEIAPDFEQMATLQTRLEKLGSAQNKNKQISQLLRKAKIAFKQGRLTSPRGRSAIFYYRNVLKLDSGNKSAKSGMNRIQEKLVSHFNQAKERRNFAAAKKTINAIRKNFSSVNLVNNMQKELDRLQRQPDFEVISGVVAKYKNVFEEKNKKLLASMSEAHPDMFVNNLFDQYKSFRIKITDLQHIRRQRKAVARVKIENLINVDGASVSPGKWGQFNIEIKQNNHGEWKVVWLF